MTEGSHQYKQQPGSSSHSRDGAAVNHAPHPEAATACDFTCAVAVLLWSKSFNTASYRDWSMGPCCSGVFASDCITLRKMQRAHSRSTLLANGNHHTRFIFIEAVPTHSADFKKCHSLQRFLAPSLKWIVHELLRQRLHKSCSAKNAKAVANIKKEGTTQSRGFILNLDALYRPPCFFATHLSRIPSLILTSSMPWALQVLGSIPSLRIFFEVQHRLSSGA